MQFRTRKAVFHRLQLLRRDDDAHLLQLLKFKIRRIELDLFELIRGNRMLVQRLEPLRVFRVVDEVDEFLSKIAGLVGSDLEEPERLIALHGLETLDESRGSTVIAQVVKGRLVGRERLCRSDLITAVLFVEFGNRLYGTVLLVVEKKCFLVVGIGLFGCRNRSLILIFFGHKAKCFLVKQKVHAAKIKAPVLERCRCPPLSAPVRTKAKITRKYNGFRRKQKNKKDHGGVAPRSYHLGFFSYSDFTYRCPTHVDK